MAWFKNFWCPLLRTNCHFVSNLSQLIGIRNVSGQTSNILKYFFMLRFLGFSNSRYISEILIQKILPNLTMVSCKETWLIVQWQRPTSVKQRQIPQTSLVSWVTWFNRQQHQLSQMVTTLERGRDNLAPNKKAPPVPWKDLFTSKPFWVSKFARVIMCLVNYFNSNLTIPHYSDYLV